MNLNEVEIMIPEADVKKRIAELGAAISQDYPEGNLLVVGVLNGAFIFMADLVRTITVPIKLDFVAASSYNDGTFSSGVVKITHELKTPVEGKDVLLVEDIVDTGNTLTALKAEMIRRGAKSVKICTLLDKPARRVKPLTADYSGFAIPDEFVVGYGLDYAEDYREYPDICKLRPEIIEKIKAGLR